MTYIAFKLQFYILSALTFPGNRTHDLGVASAMLYHLSYRKATVNVMYNVDSKWSKAAVIALDAEKAFDQIEWQYLYSVLSKFGFGKKIRTCIEMLYANQKSAVLTNLDKSDYVPLYRGTRQGCCLSPLLFNLALEPLDASISGITIGSVETRLSLFADDLLIFLKDAVDSLPPLMDLIKKIGSFSGYSINWNKSIFVPLGKKM